MQKDGNRHRRRHVERKIHAYITFHLRLRCLVIDNMRSSTATVKEIRFDLRKKEKPPHFQLHALTRLPKSQQYFFMVKVEPFLKATEPSDYSD